MTEIENKKNRIELKKIFDELFEEDEAIKKDTNAFLENLQNGDLKNLLEGMKNKLKKHRERLSKEF